MAERPPKAGIDDFSLVEIDPLATGRFGEDFDQHARVVRGVSHVRRPVADARIEGATTDRVCYRVRVTRVSDASTVAVSDGLIVREPDLCLPDRPRDEVANGSS